eukprot:1154860-Pelagomonas_calceolata.AAC.3
MIYILACEGQALHLESWKELGKRKAPTTAHTSSLLPLCSHTAAAAAAAAAAVPILLNGTPPLRACPHCVLVVLCRPRSAGRSC